MKQISNPFVVKGYVSKAYFCNREKEMETLRANFNNGLNTTLISHRRMGKTGLIHYLFEGLSSDKSVVTIYVDIYASQSLSDFISLTTEAILKKFPEKTSFGKKFFQFIKGLRPTISFDSITGDPQVSILYQSSQQQEQTLKSLLEFIDGQGVQVLMAIDEFQQINEYPEKNVEALLRTYTQQLHNIRFIFSGSKQSMMIDMFSNVKRPFYSSSRFLSLGFIERGVYSTYIKEKFLENNREITSDAVEFILEWTKVYTFYTQSVCNAVFATGSKRVDVELVKKCCVDILKGYEDIYFQYRQLVTPNQWNFLIAIAKEDRVSFITAQDFILRYNIGTPANARRLNESLMEKELILSMPDKNKDSYQLYDVFFSRWLASEF